MRMLRMLPVYAFAATIIIACGSKDTSQSDAKFMRQANSLYWYGPAMNAVRNEMMKFWRREKRIPKSSEELFAATGGRIAYSVLKGGKHNEFLQMKEVEIRRDHREGNTVWFHVSIRTIDGTMGVDLD